MDQLQNDYPWTKAPLVVGAPMRMIALSPLAIAVSQAGGFGFLAAGNDVSNLSSELDAVKAAQATDTHLSHFKNVLPVGVGVFVWAGEKLLQNSLPIFEKYRPAAIWLYAANNTRELVQWTQETRRVTAGVTKIWIQVGSVQEAVEYTEACDPEVLVVQGQDAGGHGLVQGAGIIALFPEVDDALTTLCQERQIRKPTLIAAGGVMDGRGGAAVLALDAAGFAMGTRYLASPEANIAQGYRAAVVQASDGGQATERTKLYDQLRGTTDWPTRYGGRGVLNESFSDHANGLSFEENQRLYREAEKKGDDGWGKNARMTTYAGTGVGLVREVKQAAVITEEVREDARRCLDKVANKLR